MGHCAGLTKTSTYVDSRVDSITSPMGGPMLRTKTKNVASDCDFYTNAALQTIFDYVLTKKKQPSLIPKYQLNICKKKL
jgi:hypothetical protein